MENIEKLLEQLKQIKKDMAVMQYQLDRLIIDLESDDA